MAIINGQRDAEHPAVGLLVSNGTKCTATLIGRVTVLTAAHCVSGKTTVSFEVGGVRYEAARWVPHPSYVSWEASRSDYVDLGVVTLKEAPPAIPRAMLASRAPSVGQAFTLVGYGRTSTSVQSDGVKRIAANTIDAVKALSFTYSGASGSEGTFCYGDSGGPSFSTIDGEEVLIGVHSGILGSPTADGTLSCGQAAFDIRVDAYLAWIYEQGDNDTTLDPTPPVVNIASPAADETTVPSSFVVSAAATDPLSGVALVELYIDDDLREAIAPTPDEGDAAVFGVKELAPGPHTLRIEAKDAAGNVGQATRTVTVADTIAPALAIRAPADGATVSSSFTVELAVSEARGALGQVQVYVDGKAQQGAAESPLTVPVAGLAVGEHEIWAAAQDSAGNWSYAQATVIVDEQAVAERCSAANGTGSACAMPEDTLFGGCTMGGGPGRPSWLWVLCGLAVLGRAVQRRLSPVRRSR